jgi:lysophospholipase L1-like esterase
MRAGRCLGVTGLVFVVCAACSKSSPPPEKSGDGGEIRYLALGDSFTAGTGNAPSEAFPSRLVERWQAKGRTVTLKNVAVNGYTTDDVAVREIPEVQPFHPTLVTLAIGANDRVRGTPIDVYRAHVKSLLASIVEAGVPASKIVTLPQPDWSLSPAAASFGDPARLGEDIVRLNGVLRDETEKMGARYIDLFPLMHDQATKKMLARDGLHPSAKAHDEWAEKLVDVLP